MTKSIKVIKAPKATKASKAIKAPKAIINVRSDNEVLACNLAIAKIKNESASREQARISLFELIASLSTIIQVMPKAERQGKTTQLSTQAVNKYIFENVFGFNDKTPSDETRVARGKIQVAKAIVEDYHDHADAIVDVEGIFNVYRSYLLSEFKTFKELVEFSKNGRTPSTPKTDNEKLLVSYNNLKNSLDKALDENPELASQFMAQAIEFLQAKLNTNKAKATLNYGAKKVA